jgi:hypothetical protein
LVDAGGEFFFRYYGKSLWKIVTTLFPDLNVAPWVFQENIPRSFFLSADNRKAYLDWLRAKLGLQSYSDLISIHFKENYGMALLNLYQWSPGKIFESVLDGDDVVALKRRHRPLNFWVFTSFCIYYQYSLIISCRNRSRINGACLTRSAPRSASLEAISRLGMASARNNSTNSVLCIYYP